MSAKARRAHGLKGEPRRTGGAPCEGTAPLMAARIERERRHRRWHAQFLSGALKPEHARLEGSGGAGPRRGVHRAAVGRAGARARGWGRGASPPHSESPAVGKDSRRRRAGSCRLERHRCVDRCARAEIMGTQTQSGQEGGVCERNVARQVQKKRAA